MKRLVIILFVLVMAMPAAVLADPEEGQPLVYNPVGSNPFGDDDNDGTPNINEGMTGDEEELQTDAEWLEEWLGDPDYIITLGPTIWFAGPYEPSPGYSYEPDPGPGCVGGKFSCQLD